VSQEADPALDFFGELVFSVSMAASLAMTEPNTLVAAFAITSAIYLDLQRQSTRFQALFSSCQNPKKSGFWPTILPNGSKHHPIFFAK